MTLFSPSWFPGPNRLIQHTANIEVSQTCRILLMGTHGGLKTKSNCTKIPPSGWSQGVRFAR